MGAPSLKGGDKADRLLLYALKDGRLTALKNGKPISIDHWFGELTSDLCDDLRFRREEALKCWPEVNEALETTEGQPAAGEQQNDLDTTTEAPACSASDPQQAGPARRGRRKEYDDGERHTAMLDLLAEEKAITLNDAATQIAELGRIGARREADIDRLRKGFKGCYGAAPPEGQTWADVRRDRGLKSLMN
jgi:hypothetical protein